ncbi:MAG: hypothetical protein ACI935_002563 [Moritella dasanensis]|jgi:hypothetical protein
MFMKTMKKPLACAIALSLATLCSPMAFADNLPAKTSSKVVATKDILHYFSVAEDDFSLIDPYTVLKPGDSISQNLLITKTEPLASDIIPVDYLALAGVYQYTGGINNAQLTIIDAETGDMVHRQPLILKEVYNSGLNRRTRADSPQGMKIVEFSSPVFLTAGKQYKIVIDNNDSEGSHNLRLHLLDGESEFGNAVISSQGDQGQEVGNPLWLRAYGSVEWNEYPLTIENDANNKLAFDPGWATPAPEKLIDPSGPAEVLWVNHGDIDSLISYQLLDDSIAGLIVERGALRDKLVIKATAEGKTAVVLKIDDTIVDKIILRSYKPFTIPVSYRYVALPDEAMFNSWYRGIRNVINNIYGIANVRVELDDLGIQTYDWDSDGNGGNSISEAAEVSLDNDEFYYTNLYTLAKGSVFDQVSCSNGGGSSGGGYGNERARYGYKVMDRVCGSGIAADTLAHELGHMMNLWHYSGYEDVLNQDLNLMKTGRKESNLFGFQWGVMHNILRQHQKNGTLYLDKPTIPPFEGSDTIAPVGADVKVLGKHLGTRNFLVLNDINDNESGIDITSLTVAVAPIAGIAVANLDGTLTYRHNDESMLTDRLGLMVKDKAGNQSDIIYVDIDIDVESSAAHGWLTVVLAADYVNVGMGESAVIDIFANDSSYSASIDKDSLSLGRWENGVQHGTLVPNEDGTITYTHDGGDSRTDEAKYRVEDALGRGALGGQSHINITVVDSSQDSTAPLAVSDELTVKNGKVTQLNLGLNDTDSESGVDSTRITVKEQPLHGIVEYDSAGNFTYHHDGSETESDRFAYRIKDNAGNISNIAWVTLNIETTGGAVDPGEPGTPTTPPTEGGGDSKLPTTPGEIIPDEGIDEGGNVEPGDPGTPTTPPTEGGGDSKLPTTPGEINPGQDIEEGGTVDPDEKPDTWNAGDVYNGGDEVRYDSKQWVAKWWTQGNEPGNSDVWKLNDTEAGPQAWSALMAYSGGDVVVFNSQTWQAAWWTKGDEPSNSSSVWKHYP